LNLSNAIYYYTGKNKILQEIIIFKYSNLWRFLKEIFADCLPQGAPLVWGGISGSLLFNVSPYYRRSCAILKRKALMELLSSNLLDVHKKTNKDLSLPSKKFQCNALIGLLQARKPTVCQKP